MPIPQLIWGKKNFDCQKAERWFKERRVKTAFVDLTKKSLSKGEFDSIAAAVGLDALLDREGPRFAESLIRYSTDPAYIRQIAFEDQRLLRTPIVRFGKKATVGYQPELWTAWLKEL